MQRLTGRAGNFGRYELKGEIDRGGQGAVLRVWDGELPATGSDQRHRLRERLNEIAEDFMLSVADTITAVRWWVGYASNCIRPTDDSTSSIYADPGSGEPAATGW